MKRISLYFVVVAFIFTGCQFFSQDADTISVSPKGVQKVVQGESIKYNVTVKNSFGISLSNPNGGFKYDVKYGNFDGKNYIPPEYDFSGEDTIKISIGNVSKTINVQVLPKDYLRKPFEYNGIVYKGQTSESGEKINIDPSIDLTIDYPQSISFDADGFFTIKGETDGYCFVYVTKKGNEILGQWGIQYSNYLGCSYFLKGSFENRIWLVDGPGEYTVSIFKDSFIDDFVEEIREGNNKYEPDYDCCSGNSITFYAPSIVTYIVNNTNENTDRWLYPSSYVQSDDITIYNLVEDLTYGCKNNNEKFQAINNYVASTFTYDNDSLDYRKKQDALTVLGYKKAICTGYSYLTAAMLRCAGIHTKIIVGLADPNDYGSGHAWLNVSIDDSNSWKLVEPQMFGIYELDASQFKYVHDSECNSYKDKDGALLYRVIDNEECFSVIIESPY